MIYKYSGKSLKELKAEFGTGKGRFYPQSWYENEAVFTDKPPAGIYEILIEKKMLENLTFNEQVKKLEKGWNVPHPAIVIEALLTHFKETGEYLMEYWYTRTSALDSGGGRVHVGYCDAHGVGVNGWYGGHRYDDVGLSATRKFEFELRTLESFDPLDLRSLEARVKELESFKEKIEKVIRI